MIVHIEKLIRHLRSQIESADKVDSEFVYLTKREAEGCLELAEAQDVIQEMVKDAPVVVMCRDCMFCCYYLERVENEYVCIKNMDKWGRIPENDLKGHRANWYCADGKRKETK